jgi:Na+-transporting NADH:ubiquinone oxidoreductase subunit B
MRNRHIIRIRPEMIFGKIRKVFEKNRRHFLDGGKLKSLRPLFDALETFFFTPQSVTVEGPHVRDGIDLKRFMSFVVIALLPSFFFGIYNAGYQSNLMSGFPLDFRAAFSKGLIIVLPAVFVSYAVGFFWEILFASIRKHKISEGFLVTGLLFPMTLPPTIPLWQVALGISFGVVIGKEVFGGTGRNLLNPALTGRAFLFFAYPAKMTGDSVWTVVDKLKDKSVDIVSGATPLAVSALAGINENIEMLLNQKGYSFLKLFTGRYPGCIGETSTILCIAGALFLIVTGIASYRIILGGILGVLSTGYLLNIFASESSAAWLSLNPFYHLVMGGFAFGISFMATDPVSAPGMEKAKWIYGVAIGILTVLIRVFNPAYSEGVMMAILFMNLFSPLLDYIEIRLRLKKRIPNV